MNLLIIVAAVVTYFYGCGRLIRWASARADREPPKWGEMIAMLFWPGLVARLVRWLLPSSLGAWEQGIALAASFTTLFLILVLWFKLRIPDALLIWLGIIILALLMVLKIAPSLSAGKPAALPVPTVPTP